MKTNIDNNSNMTENATANGISDNAIKESPVKYATNGETHSDDMIVQFVLPDGEVRSVAGHIGLSLLEIARKHDIPIEGACEGSLACSTCHVIVEPSWFAKLPTAFDAEEDMLDLAFGVTKTSRLCCQIIFTEEMSGITVQVPSCTRNVMF